MVLSGRGRSINHSHFSWRSTAANIRDREPFANVDRKEMMAFICSRYGCQKGQIPVGRRELLPSIQRAGLEPDVDHN